MEYARFAVLSNEEVADALKTSPDNGLSPAEISHRLQTYGRNAYRSHETAWWEIFLRQFRSSFVYLLVGAAALSAALGELFNAGMILFFVCVNTTLCFYQEYRSEQTAKLLQRYLKEQIHVKRNGEIVQIGSEDIVPGDIILLQTGDKVAADVRLTDTTDLLTDESSLSGESVPVHKKSSPLKEKPNKISDAANIAFCGTTIVSGRAEGIVLATGSNTVFGGISKLTTDTVHISSFSKGINEFSRFILRLIGGTIVVVFTTHVFMKGVSSTEIGSVALFAIALAVGVIPEALPVVTTFSLSRGALRLAKHHVVVKRLSAIEDLGSIEVLCSDKTGTLTENIMTVDAVFGSDRTAILSTAAFASESDPRDATRTNPLDAAILATLPKKYHRALTQATLLKHIPFDPERRRNSALVKHDGVRQIIMRGAPEAIVPNDQHLSKKERDTIDAWVADQGSRGRRVIAIAARDFDKDIYHISDEDHCRFVGCISFLDPIKKTTKRAVDDAKRLGVAIKILTGDSPTVAGAVAHEVGLISSPDMVISGDAFMALSPAEQAEHAERFAVFARLSPEQKFHIIELLEKKHEVGFLGEGINDAPGLKVANVGMVVYGASHVAQEAADIILLGKSLHVIIDGIREGREIFANTIKYIKITLASNFGNFYALAFASFLIEYLPMLPLQLLLLNLLSDFPMISIATDTVDHNELRSPRGYDVRSITLLATILGLVSTMFDFIFFGLFKNISPSVLQTNWFMGSILTELIIVFSIRSRRPFFLAPRPSTFLFLLTGLAASATLILPYTSIGHDAFQFTAPSATHLSLILLVVVTYFLTSEIVKLLYYRYINHESR